MRIEEIIPALRSGERIRRKRWNGSSDLVFDGRLRWADGGGDAVLCLNEVLVGDDWYVVETAVPNLQPGDTFNLGGCIFTVGYCSNGTVYFSLATGGQLRNESLRTIAKQGSDFKRTVTIPVPMVCPKGN
jgi:hypothetical protein